MQLLSQGLRAMTTQMFNFAVKVVADLIRSAASAFAVKAPALWFDRQGFVKMTTPSTELIHLCRA